MPARPLVAVALVSLTLVGCTTRVVETRRAPAPGTLGAVTHYGFRDGEIVLRLTPLGEQAVAPAADLPPGRLRFGVASLDRLNVKYRATAIERRPEQGAYLLRLAPDANVPRAAEEYAADPLVLDAHPHYWMHLPQAAEEPEAVRTRVGPRDRTPTPAPAD